MAKKKELWVAVYHHEYGVDVRAFYFIPVGDLKYPSPKAVALWFNIDFEPDKSESFELIQISNQNMPEVLGDQITPDSEPPLHVGRTTLAPANWADPDEEDWDNEGDMFDQMDSGERAELERQLKKFTPPDDVDDQREEQRRDEKRGLYPQHDDPSN